MNLKVVHPLPRTKTLSYLMEQGFTHLRVIADVHGNLAELEAIVKQTNDETFLLFLGDLVDYGPHPWDVVELAHELVAAGRAVMIRGNHEEKMHRYINQTLRGEEFKGKITHGMPTSVDQLSALPDSRREQVQQKFLALVEWSPDWVEIGDWMFVHAALDRRMVGNTMFRAHKKSRLWQMALYGETDGTVDENGFPNRRHDWIEKVPSGISVCVGHQVMSMQEPVLKYTPSGSPVLFLDTGSGKGGFLSHQDFILSAAGLKLLPA